MKIKLALVSLLILLLQPHLSFSQTDVYPGSWEMNYVPGAPLPPVHIELVIALPEKNIIYPAQLKISCEQFSGIYELLLVKKNNLELGISRNKFPVSETPFSLSNATAYLNNIFSINKDKNGNPVLIAERLTSKKFEKTFPGIIYPDSVKQLTTFLKDFLKGGDILLKKRNAVPWTNDKNNPGTSFQNNPYFGILDSIHVDSRHASVTFPVNRKKDNDTVSVILNNISVAGDIDTRKKNRDEDLELEPGLNILALFADNYGKSAPNTGLVNIDFGKRKMILDFNRPADQYATFIVAMVYYFPGKEDSLALKNKFHGENFEMMYEPSKELNKYTGKETQHILQRPTKNVGQLETKSSQITLALWDDAVEDGDSISLNINGKWLVQGFAVKKQTQFIRVTLKPGPNQIIFIADNLGSIIPNTSVLEIIDGRQRRSFKIDTDMDRNNMISIFYDFDPAK